LATKTLTRFLMNCGFGTRLSGSRLGVDDYVFAFRCNGGMKYAAWTTSWLAQSVAIPLNRGTYRITSANGESVERATTQTGLFLNLTSTPQYLESNER
jgi:hypothetical protein